MKKVFVLGSTGSIGVNALNVIRKFPDKFSVVGLTANSNSDLLLKQIREFKPTVASIGDDVKAKQISEAIDFKCDILTGNDFLLKATRETDYDILVSSLVGFAGLAPTIESIKRGKRIALANKETLVVAGEIIVPLCSEYKAELLPVDSEHSAIFQCLAGEKHSEVDKLILTASGGPFFNKSPEELENVTVEQALRHPNWEMGNKITIDSATMMNKGLEVIEAHWLFGFNADKIDVIIHPQSIIHSMVKFVDGSIKAQLSFPDMKLPIQYALSYPERLPSDFVQTDFVQTGELSFFQPDPDKFQCLSLAIDAMKTGGLAPCILNAANEVAVDKFLKGEIKFSYISKLISEALNKIDNQFSPSLETIFECDRQTREFALKFSN